MNPMTFTIPLIPVLGGLSVLVSSFLAGKLVRKWKKGRKKRKADADAASQKEKSDYYQELARLFPSPWDEAFVKCRDMPGSDSNPKSRIFIRHWLSEQCNLPRLSREAVHRLACQLTKEYCSKWNECLDILAPYSEVKSTSESARLQEEADKKALFNYPWSEAYEVCRKSDSYTCTQAWFKKWIAAQNGSLPKISLPAAQELISQVESGESEDFSTYFDLVSPHLDTGYVYDTGTPNEHVRVDGTSNSLKGLVPDAWFIFYEEIKDYPARRSLFLEKVGLFRNNPNFPSLTARQAILLAKTLGENESEVGFYAGDLKGYVKLTADGTLKEKMAARKIHGLSTWTQDDERIELVGNPIPHKTVNGEVAYYAGHPKYNQQQRQQPKNI
jgi:hypothetical protein